MTDQPLVLAERRDDYAIVTLNRPEKRNAVSVALAHQLMEELAALEAVPVIVITGAGQAFCAGVDLKERRRPRTWSENLGAGDGQYWAETIERIRLHPAVFIAAVNGFALGGGVTLVNNAELAVASNRAEFGMPEVSFGSYPALAGPTTIQRIMPKHAFQMALLAERVDADTACHWGLVNEVVEHDDLLSRAGELAAAVAKFDPIALAHTKRALRAAIEMGWSEGIEHGAITAGLIQSARGLRTQEEEL
jgi:enoyl-CoA hydratase/carnithine racemase